MADPASWDLLDEDCSDISDWQDVDLGDGISWVNPVGQFEMDANTAGATNYARRLRYIDSFPNTFTVEIKVYHDKLGTRTNGDEFQSSYRQADEGLNFNCASDGLWLYDNDEGWYEVGTDLVKHGGSAEWQIWRFLVTFTGTTGDGTCDIFLTDSTHTNEKVATATPCSHEKSVTEGEIYLFQEGLNTADTMTHIDYVKAATGLYDPTVEEAVENAVFFGANF